VVLELWSSSSPERHFCGGCSSGVPSPERGLNANEEQEEKICNTFERLIYNNNKKIKFPP
jgi:hypothetical protein